MSSDVQLNSSAEVCDVKLLAGGWADTSCLNISKLLIIIYVNVSEWLLWAEKYQQAPRLTHKYVYP